jgi:hypothetical protein
MMSDWARGVGTAAALVLGERLSPMSFQSKYAARSATANPAVIVFGGWRFAQISSAMGAHGKRI